MPITAACYVHMAMVDTPIYLTSHQADGEARGHALALAQCTLSTKKAITTRRNRTLSINSHRFAKAIAALARF
jgi:hypothetical protein